MGEPLKTDQHAQTVRYNNANIVNANAQTESLRAQRDAAIAEKDQKRALGVNRDASARCVRIPAHAEHGFRLKLNADSGGS